MRVTTSAINASYRRRLESPLRNLKDQRRRIVFAVGLHCLGHEALGHVSGSVLRRVANETLHAAVPKAFDETIRAKEEGVAPVRGRPRQTGD